MLKFAILVLGVLSLSSCSVVVKAPLSRFESPETRGKSMGVEALMAYQGRTEVLLTKDYLVSGPDMNDPVIDEDPGHRLMGSASLGLMEKLDVSLTLPDARVGLKYQLFGEGREKTKEGNFPVSVLAGFSKRSEDKSDSGFFTPTQTVSYKLTESQADVGVVTGYRLQDTLLVYGGVYYLWDQLRTTYANPSTSAGLNNSGIMRVYDFNFGVQKEVDKVVFRLESSISDTTLGRKKDTAITYGGAVGTYF